MQFIQRSTVSCDVVRVDGVSQLGCKSSPVWPRVCGWKLVSGAARGGPVGKCKWLARSSPLTKEIIRNKEQRTASRRAVDKKSPSRDAFPMPTPVKALGAFGVVQLVIPEAASRAAKQDYQSWPPAEARATHSFGWVSPGLGVYHSAVKRYLSPNLSDTLSAHSISRPLSIVPKDSKHHEPADPTPSLQLSVTTPASRPYR